MRGPILPLIAVGVVVVALVLAGAFVAGRLMPSHPPSPAIAEPLADCADDSAAPDRQRPAGSLVLSTAELDRVAATAVAAVMADPPSEIAAIDNQTDFGPAYVVLRRAGVALSEAWADGDDALAAVRNATQAALDGLPPERRDRPIEAIEIVLSHSFQRMDVPSGAPSAVLSNVHRGVRGLEITLADRTVLISPTRMLATNRAFGRALEVALDDLGSSMADLRSRGTVRQFEAEQLLVVIGQPSTVHRMERGNTCLPLEAVTRDAVATLVEGMADWMVQAVHDDGRMTYKYWPSLGEESSANNMIRQWMATTALGRVAAARESDELWELSRRNVAYNLEQFFETEDGLGLIVEDGTKVKLGAVALAGRALVEHRDREDYAETEAALSRMVDHLWREDGSFKTWYRPPEFGGQENFYPGEALYFWSAVYADSQDPVILERFMRSFRYYRDWHLDPANRNPAFVPWHTQACYEMWQQTEDPELAAFIFEMNDWLLDVQEWDAAVYRDTLGRFYDPNRPFGPPHASSTGVYLEGLVDAYRLARTLDDDERVEAYRTAIVRGLRNVMQLQFADEVDMFYISQKDRVRGGIRTEVYDNEIRVDNVQHNLMAALKVMQAFPEGDFRP